MRNYSKEACRNYYKRHPSLKTMSVEKNYQGAINLKDSEVKVGRYKYDLKDELGKGYSSFVYKGVEISKIHKRYAIKVIDLKKFRGSNLQMLEAEIEIHKNLEHENIVKLYQVIKTSHHYYLIMEYCPHGNLQQYIHQKKQLCEENCIEIMDQVIKAYKHLQNQGIIHRDIKPANILRNGNKWKISDFGFAIKSKFGFRDRMNVGTPLYMPPQSLKKNYYSNKSDYFALGVVMHEMIQGRTPWEASTEKQLLENLNKQIQMPKYVKDQRLMEFYLKTCQINQNKRFSKDQFMEFQIKNASTMALSLEQSRFTNSTCNLKSRRLSTATDSSSGKSEEHLKQIKKNPMNLNKDILSNEFNFVKLLYSIIQNIQSFELEDNLKQVFVLAIFKLMLKNLRLLCEKYENKFALQHWQAYRECKMHVQFNQAMVEQSEKYEKEYLQFIKHNDIKVIRAVNRKFAELSQTSALSFKFFEHFKTFLIEVIQEQNQMVLQLVNQETENLNDRFHALETLYQVYQIIDTKSHSLIHLDEIMEKVHLLEDFTQSKLSKHNFLDLRRLLKNLVA